jgi:hypothetical protein
MQQIGVSRFLMSKLVLMKKYRKSEREP